jgi:hypothetical protein
MKPNSMESFFTRSSANTGIDLPLYTPDGLKSEHSLHIIGVDSDIFRQTELTEKRRAVSDTRSAGKDPVELDKLVEESKLRLLASLIVSWTFEQECSLENKLNFLREAPQIAQAINTHSADRTLFFVNASTNSADSQKPTSD